MGKLIIFSETTKLARMHVSCIHSNFMFVWFFLLVLFGNSKWQPQRDTVSSQDPMEKRTEHFFLKTTNLIKYKLYMNNNWMVLTKFSFFVPIRNPRMPSLQDKFNIEPYWKMNKTLSLKLET